MAETDGTPRYRKSKPPKGANGSDARDGARNSRPGAKARKRAALRNTLPSGSAVESEPSVVTPPTGVNVPDLANSVVKTTMPTVIRQDASTSVLAEAHDMRGTVARSTAPLAGGTPGPQPRTIRSALGSTLRMELTVHKGEGPEPQIQLRTTAPLGNAGIRDEKAGFARSKSGPAPEDPATLRDNFMRSRKATTQGFAPAFPDPSARTARFETSGVGADTRARARPEHLDHPDHPNHRHHDDFGPRPSSGAPPMSTSGNHPDRPRRPRRPGERTLIMTRRSKRGSKRDWLFVVLLVAALGLTASMFLSQQNPTEEVVDASAYDDTQDQQDQQDQQEGPDPFAPTTLRPWAERGQANGMQSDTSALTARGPSVAANSVQATELRSQPAGAEVVAGNAVVGSTPVRVARGSADMVYLLRLKGYESKVVRVGPNSPPTILVELMPLTPPAAAEAPAAAAPSGTLPAQ